MFIHPRVYERQQLEQMKEVIIQHICKTPLDVAKIIGCEYRTKLIYLTAQMIKRYNITI